MVSESQKLSIKEKVGYSLGDCAANFYFQTFLIFLLFFYTDVFGISAKVVGTMFLLSRIWDAVNDPMMGAIADRTNTRWGKFRPWILITAIPLAIVGILAFTTPNISTFGKIIWACVTYNLLMMLYTANNVPYSALMGVITGDSIERTVVASWRFIFAMLAAFAIQGLMLPMVNRLGQGNDARGFQLTMTFFAVLGVIFLFITFFSTKERVKPDPNQKTSIRQDLSDLIKNGPWVALFFLTVSIFIYLSMRGGIGLYYFTYFVNQESLLGFLGNIRLLNILESVHLIDTSKDLNVVTIGFTFFSVSGLTATIIGIFFSKALAAKFGKRNVFRVCLFITACFTVVYVFLPAGAVVLMFACQIIMQFFYGITIPLLWAMMADVADYTEWKTGHRATAMTFAAAMFGLKLGLSLGGAIAGWLLSFYGYVPDVEQTATALKGIRYLMSIFPAIMFFIGVGALFFYKIDKTMEHKVQYELTERRKQYKYD